MIEINKQGNAIRIDFTDNDKYLFNGTMEVASNELMLVVDESDMITFKRTTNGDVLFSQAVNKIKISGSAVTKDNVIEQFATIGYSQSGGGGEAGAVTSVNGKTGDVVLTATSLGAITKADADTLYATKSDLNSKADISAVEALSTEVAANRTATTALTSKVNEDSEKIASLDTEMDNKANSADVPTNTQFNNLAGEVANKADKTSVYTKQEADEEFATNVELNHVKAELATKADTSSLNDYALKSEITGLATKEELADYQPIGDYATTTQLNSKQDTLVSGQNIKTINGQSVIGEGNIDIVTVDSELSTDSENPVQNKVITNALNDKASKTELSNVSTSKANKADVYTKQEVDNKFTNAQNQIDQISTDTSAINTEVQTLKTDKQDTLVSGTNIKTVNGESILGNGNLVIQSGTSNWDDIQGKPQFARVATSGDYNDLINKPTIPDVSGLATKEEIADMETKSNAAATYATKQEIPSLEGYLTETVASETYATKQELGNKLDTATYNSEKAGFETKENAAATYQVKGDYATKSEIPTATSQLTNDSGFITEIPSEYITETELSSSLNSKADSANVYTKAEIDNMIGEISARLDQINGEVI